MRLELISVGLLVEIANHYTTRGALNGLYMITSQWLAVIILAIDISDNYST